MLVGNCLSKLAIACRFLLGKHNPFSCGWVALSTPRRFELRTFQIRAPSVYERPDSPRTGCAMVYVCHCSHRIHMKYDLLFLGTDRRTHRSGRWWYLDSPLGRLSNLHFYTYNLDPTLTCHPFRLREWRLISGTLGHHVFIYTRARVYITQCVGRSTHIGTNETDGIDDIITLAA